MPNTFAYVVLLSWPLVVIAIFRFLSLPYALPISVIGGYLFLPERTSFDFPFLPAIDKTTIPSVSAAIMCYWLSRRNSRIDRARARIARAGAIAANDDHPAQQTSGRSPFVGLMITALLVSPWITAWHNAEPVIAGPTVIPGLRVYDAASITGNFVVMLIPFLLARRLLATPQAHLKLLQSLAASGAVYAFLVLFEARMSPQLNVWVYGFFSHSWLQHLRGDGYRPLVFLNHGLWVAIFMAMSLLSALTLWRTNTQQRGRLQTAFLLVIWLSITLVFCRSLGALLVAITMGAAIIIASPRMQVSFAAVIAIALLCYPALRGADLVPIQRIEAAAAWLSPERAESLDFRIRNEEKILNRANEKPLAGWGGYGRSQIFDSQTGEDSTVVDSMWIVIISQNGWLGYIAIFGLLTIPTILFWKSGRSTPVPSVTAGLMVTMAAALVDLMNNATLTPVTWLLAGAVAGAYKHATIPLTSQKTVRVSQTTANDALPNGHPQARPTIRSAHRTRKA